MFGDDAYPDLITKAPALLQSVVKNHALIDRNERLGWLAAAVFLTINEVDVTVAWNDDIYTLVMDMAAGSLGVEEVAKQLRALLRVR